MKGLAKKRAKTLAEFLGFRDPDLETPEHDEIIMSLNDNNRLAEVLESCINQFYEPKLRVRLRDCEDLECWGARFYCKLLEKKGDIYYRYEYCKFNFSTLGKNGGCPKDKELYEEFSRVARPSLKELIARTVKKEFEAPILRDNNYVVGFVDVKGEFSRFFGSRHFEWRYEPLSTRFFIEVKPKIKSVGATMRQMKMYMTFLKNHLPIIVTGTSGLKDLFNGQGICVYEWR